MLGLQVTLTMTKREVSTRSVPQRHGGEDADAHEEDRSKDPDRQRHRDRGAGDTGPTSAPGHHGTSGAAGVPGGAVSTDRGRERSGDDRDQSRSAGGSARTIKSTRFG